VAPERRQGLSVALIQVGAGRQGNSMAAGSPARQQDGTVTISRDYFSTGEIGALSPLARLLYLGLCCDSDRGGAILYDPYSWKLRYLPSDNDCDVVALVGELQKTDLLDSNCDDDEWTSYVKFVGVRRG
jgi:hypothetical protein